MSDDCDDIVDSNSLSFSILLAANTRLAQHLDASMDNALPMPEEAPVITIFLPFSEFI